ncbi:MAG: energy-coupling factor transporter ATPase [Clostridiales bacterium]|nr:MAG: energy-coupling factor transporter ATPase [Clostridiales bacterium]
MSIQFKNVNYIYSPNTPYRTVALQDVSFTIEDGAFIGCIGHTGSGKSTLMQLMNGLLKPTAGEIIVDGVTISEPKVKLADLRKRVGLVFQYPEYQLFEETIYDDVAYGPKNLDVSAEEVAERVAYALAAVNINLDDAKVRSPFELSGGQKRRVAIAGVLAMKPRVLILDEPTAGLDPAGHKEILDLIKREHKRQKRITILVSHSMDDVAKYVDKILVLDKGQLVYFDSPGQIFGQRDNLAKMGLDVPTTTKIIAQLHARGIAIDSTIFDVEQLSQALLQHLRKQHD